MNRARVITLLAAAGLATLILAGGCDKNKSEKDDPALPTDVSPLVLAALQHQQELLDGPYPSATSEPTVRQYFWFRNALYDPAQRQAAADSFFATWEREPEQVMWAEVGHVDRYFLGRNDHRLALMDRAASEDTATALFQFIRGRILWASDRQGAALAFRSAAKTSLADEPSDSLLIVWSHMRAASLERYAGNPDLSIRLFTEIMPMAWATGGASLAHACWKFLATSARASGRLGDARGAARMAEDCAIRAGSGYMQVYAGFEVGRVQMARREYAAAEKTFARCFEISRDSNFVRWQTDSIGKTFELARATGDIDREVSVLASNLTMARANTDTSYMIRISLALANALKRRGDLDSAMVWFDRADTMNTYWTGEDSGVPIRRYRAMLLYQMGRYTEAESLRSLDVGRTDHVFGREGEIELEISLANQGIETGRPDLAYRSLARARTILDAGLEVMPNWDSVFQVELAAAQLHAQQGEYHLADAALLAASERTENATWQTSWFLEHTRGLVALRSGDLATAEKAFSACASLADSLRDPDLVRRTRVRLGLTLIQGGRYAAAESLVVHDLQAPTYWTRLNAHLLTGMARTRSGHHNTALAVFAATDSLINRDAPMDILARLGLEQGRTLAALDRNQEAFETLTAIREKLTSQRANTGGDEDLVFGESVEREIAEALVGLLFDNRNLVRRGSAGQFAREIAAWGRGTASGTPVGARVEYFVGEERAFAWWASGPDQKIRWRELPPAAELGELIAALLTDMSYPDREIDVAGSERLGLALLSPLVGHWEPGQVLEIVPDGPLFALPWAALPWHDGGQSPAVPLLQHGPLVLLAGIPSELDSPPRTGGMLAIGNDGSEVRLGLAEAEARAVADLWHLGPVDLRVGGDLVLDDLLAGGMRNRQVIHIASHTQVFEGDAGHSAIHLAGSGLPLTVPQLSAGVVDAQLVYVSSCQGSRRHRNPGRGVVSFAEVFLAAGADEVIASSVLINDEAALLVAETFYREWQDGAEKAAALRTALLNLSGNHDRWGHPFHWGFYNLYRRPAP